jgi:hypothetical protein
MTTGALSFQSAVTLSVHRRFVRCKSSTPGYAFTLKMDSPLGILMNCKALEHYISRNPMDRDLIVGQVLERCKRFLEELLYRERHNFIFRLPV